MNAARRRLASPLRASIIARNLGLAARLVAFLPPRIFGKNFGLNCSALHSVARNSFEAFASNQAPGLAGSLPPPKIPEPILNVSRQVVGLTVKFERLIETSIERMSSFTPPNMYGIGSETAWTSAVSGLMLTAARTATVPRSYGPATAGVTNRRLIGAPLYGPAR